MCLSIGEKNVVAILHAQNLIIALNSQASEWKEDFLAVGFSRSRFMHSMDPES
jgi:hypothetical protein